MAKKYIKNENGIVRAVTSDNLQLEKPLANENYDIEVHNRNMDKIDSAIQDVKGKIDGLELVASKVAMADGSTVEATVTTNKSNISTLQSEVSANKSNISTLQSEVSANKTNITTLQTTVNTNKTNITNNTNLANQALTKATEAFQRGDEVKGKFVDKLISQGLNVSTGNTFEELIAKISLGRRYASGSVTSHYDGGYFFKVANLGFKPTCVIGFTKNSTTNNAFSIAFYHSTNYYCCVCGIGNGLGKSSLSTTGTDISSSLIMKMGSTYSFAKTYINDSEVVLKCPDNFHNNVDYKYYWYAFE